MVLLPTDFKGSAYLIQPATLIAKSVLILSVFKYKLFSIIRPEDLVFHNTSTIFIFCFVIKVSVNHTLTTPVI
jgi:hypothetical protein